MATGGDDGASFPSRYTSCNAILTEFQKCALRNFSAKQGSGSRVATERRAGAPRCQYTHHQGVLTIVQTIPPPGPGSVSGAGRGGGRGFLTIPYFSLGIGLKIGS